MRSLCEWKDGDVQAGERKISTNAAENTGLLSELRIRNTFEMRNLF